MDDQPELIQQRLSRRDGFAGDRINVIIDSYHDKRTAFVFTTTAAGVKGEEIATQNGNQWDDSWNPIWYTNAKIDAEGWTAEMKIPLKSVCSTSAFVHSKQKHPMLMQHWVTLPNVECCNIVSPNFAFTTLGYIFLCQH